MNAAAIISHATLAPVSGWMPLAHHTFFPVTYITTMQLTRLVSARYKLTLRRPLGILTWNGMKETERKKKGH